MREGYYCGAPGVLVSGLVWTVAGLVAISVSYRAGVFTLLLGGGLIFPLSVAVRKMLGVLASTPQVIHSERSLWRERYGFLRASLWRTACT